MNLRELKIVNGQRFSSESEPELGLGIVEQVDSNTINVIFQEKINRCYSLDSAPLKRIEFGVGNDISSSNGITINIESISNDNGVLIYHGQGKSISESEITSESLCDDAFERLLRGDIDHKNKFSLRGEARKIYVDIQKSPVRGLVGGRIDRHSHQLYVSKTITDQMKAKALLAEEVGLGKTIEACLVLNRLIKLGRVQNALIIVPKPLIHQWFVELLRRFSLKFSLYGQEQYIAYECMNDVGENTNIFDKHSFILTSYQFLQDTPKAISQVTSKKWDMLIIDEAHRLFKQSDDENHWLNLFKARSTLLLSATPMQKGWNSYFHQLCLLGEYRDHEIERFERDQKKIENLVDLTEALQKKIQLTEKQQMSLNSYQNLDPRIEGIDEGIDSSKLNFLAQHYPGGSKIFRNTRKAIAGFPKRVSHFYPFRCDLDKKKMIRSEVLRDIEEDDSLELDYNFKDDERINWIVDAIQKKQEQKVLLICRFADKAKKIAEILKKKSKKLKVALFIESMTLLDRDRNAAWFSESDGAQVLVCSEIGSEGRNFQFTNQLFLFDLPLNPELLEQRIGRLDRIGQEKDIHIHVPFYQETHQQYLVELFRDGLNCFEISHFDAPFIFQDLGADWKKSLKEYKTYSKSESSVNIRKTKERLGHYQTKSNLKRNSLLERNSHDLEIGLRIKNEIKLLDEDFTLEKFVLNACDLFGVALEEIDKRVYQIKTDLFFHEALDTLKKGKWVLCFDRQKALHREDWEFVTIDHPLITNLFDIIFSENFGSTTAVSIPLKKEWPPLFMECRYICSIANEVCPGIQQYFQPKWVQIKVDHMANIFAVEEMGSEGSISNGTTVEPKVFQNQIGTLVNLLPNMNQATKDQGRAWLEDIKVQEKSRLMEICNQEVEELKLLNKLTGKDGFRSEKKLKRKWQVLLSALDKVDLELESVCLVFNNGGS